MGQGEDLYSVPAYFAPEHQPESTERGPECGPGWGRGEGGAVTKGQEL